MIFLYNVHVGICLYTGSMADSRLEDLQVVNFGKTPCGVKFQGLHALGI